MFAERFKNVCLRKLKILYNQHYLDLGVKYELFFWNGTCFRMNYTTADIYILLFENWKAFEQFIAILKLNLTLNIFRFCTIKSKTTTPVLLLSSF